MQRVFTGARRSEPGYRRPILIIQLDEFNRSRIRTVIAALLNHLTPRSLKRTAERLSSHLNLPAIAKIRCKSSLNHQAALTKSVSPYFPLSAVDSVGQQQ